MPDLLLTACRVEPLSSYLKALGILRLVGEQADPEATGRWIGDAFELRSAFDLDGLVEFFTDRYRPTPIVTPWNSGSGFGVDDATKSRTAFDAMKMIAGSDDERLVDYGEAIAVAGRLAALPEWATMAKEQQVAWCRNTMPDAALGWIDASIVITAERASFPPLLGTGGNDGRLDFGSNVMQRVGELFGLDARSRKARRPVDILPALVRAGAPKLEVAKMGQFDPAGAGGPRADPFGDAVSLGSVWDFVLMFEGSLLLASGVARRLSGGSATAAPFILPATAAGFASAADESSRGEFWAPVWDRHASLPELRRLLSEGRVDVSGRQARTSLDMARGVAAYGADRGVASFVRFGFIERNGLSTFAVPVGRHRVNRLDRRSASVLGRADAWISRLRNVSNPPASLAARLRAVDGLQFAVCDAGDHARPALVQELLAEVASIERLAARSRAVRERTGPVAGLAANDWVPLLDDGSAEVHLAIALASMRRSVPDQPGRAAGLLRGLLTDVGWVGRGSLVEGFTVRPITEVLADCAERLLIERVDALGPRAGCFGEVKAVWSPLGAVAALLDGSVDVRRLEEVLSGALLLDWGRERVPGRSEPFGGRSSLRLPVAYPLLKAAMHHEQFDAERPLRARPEWLRRARAGRLTDALDQCVRELRIRQHRVLVHSTHAIAGAVDPSTLIAACLVPISTSSLAHVLTRVAEAPDSTDSSSTLEEHV